MSSLSGGSADTATEGVQRVAVSAKASRRLISASVISVISFVLLLIAFASPYWLSSYKYTYSPFVRLGLWDFCFNNYRHPPYQYDEKFNGCHYIYSSKYQNIRDWLQPGMFCVCCFTKFVLFAVRIWFCFCVCHYLLIVILLSPLHHLDLV